MPDNFVDYKIRFLRACQPIYQHLNVKFTNEEIDFPWVLSLVAAQIGAVEVNAGDMPRQCNRRAAKKNVNNTAGYDEYNLTRHNVLMQFWKDTNNRELVVFKIKVRP